MNRASDIELLREVEHFAELEDDELEDLLEICESRTIVSGEPIWSAGERGESAYMLVSGRIEWTWRAPIDGREQTQLVRSGEFVGLPYLVGDWEHESTAYAVERTELIAIDRVDFRGLFDEQHPAAYRLTDLIAEALVKEVRDANERLNEVFGHPAETLRMLRRRTSESKRS